MKHDDQKIQDYLDTFGVGDLVRRCLDGEIGIVISTDTPHTNKGVRVEWLATRIQENFYKAQAFQLKKL
tara:strand:+ start:438 stop:644 length:207 start_codon:yes stop_codon:yes gene_type:complete